MGYSYCGLLGELLYAYVIAHPDLGNALVTLSKLSNAPAKIHYQQLKHMAIYLCNIKDLVIIYWCTMSCDILSSIPFDVKTVDSTLIIFFQHPPLN